MLRAACCFVECGGGELGGQRMRVARPRLAGSARREVARDSGELAEHGDELVGGGGDARGARDYLGVGVAVGAALSTKDD